MLAIRQRVVLLKKKTNEHTYRYILIFTLSPDKNQAGSSMVFEMKFTAYIVVMRLERSLLLQQRRVKTTRRSAGIGDSPPGVEGLSHIWAEARTEFLFFLQISACLPYFFLLLVRYGCPLLLLYVVWLLIAEYSCKRKSHEVFVTVRSTDQTSALRYVCSQL